jgi:hypothetical protein
MIVARTVSLKSMVAVINFLNIGRNGEAGYRVKMIREALRILGRTYKPTSGQGVDLLIERNSQNTCRCSCYWEGLA